MKTCNGAQRWWHACPLQASLLPAAGGQAHLQGWHKPAAFPAAPGAVWHRGGDCALHLGHPAPGAGRDLAARFPCPGRRDRSLIQVLGSAACSSTGRGGKGPLVSILPRKIFDPGATLLVAFCLFHVTACTFVSPKQFQWELLDFWASRETWEKWGYLALRRKGSPVLQGHEPRWWWGRGKTPEQPAHAETKPHSLPSGSGARPGLRSRGCWSPSPCRVLSITQGCLLCFHGPSPGLGV